MVSGLGEVAGKALALHPDVLKIGFTGSTEVGKLLLQYAGQSNMKKVSLETGGKSPMIFFADLPDMDQAVDTCLLYTSPSPRDYAASRMPSSA